MVCLIEFHFQCWRLNNMNELNCKECETPVECEEGVSGITCSMCCATIGICMEEN